MRPINTTPALDCPLTEAAQDVPMHAITTMQAFRDEQARRLYEHACKLERQQRKLLTALDLATATVELHTGNGARTQPEWPLVDGEQGNIDYDAVARQCRALIAEVRP